EDQLADQLLLVGYCVHHKSTSPNGTAKLPRPPPITLKLEKPRWRARSASAVGLPGGHPARHPCRSHCGFRNSVLSSCQGPPERTNRSLLMLSIVSFSPPAGDSVLSSRTVYVTDTRPGALPWLVVFLTTGLPTKYPSLPNSTTMVASSCWCFQTVPVSLSSPAQYARSAQNTPRNAPTSKARLTSTTKRQRGRGL